MLRPTCIFHICAIWKISSERISDSKALRSESKSEEDEMVLFNYATRELTAKVVYYGPGLCGKTTNLEYIHKALPEKSRGKMLSLATQTDRTLFFDFLPLDLGSVKGMKTRVQLYTVPGQ